LLLERKDDIRRRELASPGDALALTFARPVVTPDPGEETISGPVARLPNPMWHPPLIIGGCRQEQSCSLCL
jgi:hypothetical protein